MKTILMQITLSFFCLFLSSISSHAMKRKAEDNIEGPAKRQKLDDESDFSVIYTSLIPALLNNNEHIFEQRSKESVQNLFNYQCQQNAEHLLLSLPQKMSDVSQENFKKFIEAKGSQGIEFLRDQVAFGNEMLYFIGLQYLKSVSLFDKVYDPSDDKGSLDVIINFLEWKNEQMTMIALLTFARSSDKPISSSKPDVEQLKVLFEKEIGNFKELEAINLSAHQILYPFMKDVEKVRESAIKKAFEIIVREEGDEKELGVALCLFGNIWRKPKPEEAIKFDVNANHILNICKKYNNNNIIMQNACFLVRNLTVVDSPKKDVDQHMQLMIPNMSHPDLKVAMWASRAYGSIVTQKQKAKEPFSLEELYKLLHHPHEEIANWALSFIGVLAAEGSPPQPSLHKTNESESFYRVLSLLQEEMIKEKQSGKLIEAALWCLGNLVQKQKVDQIPVEVISFLNPNILSAFPKNGEKLILFAARCISNLTSSEYPSKIVLSPDIFQKIVALLEVDNEKIAAWTICFFGSLSSNAMPYKEANRKQVATLELMRKLVLILRKHDVSPKILEATLWSVHKIAWCQDNVNTLWLLNCEKLIMPFLEHPVAKVREGAFLSFSVLATDDFLKKGIKIIIKSLRAEGTERLIACRCLNTLVTTANRVSRANREILSDEKGLFEDLTRLLSDENMLVVEAASWCLGNLALRTTNVEKICTLALDKIIALLDKSNPIYPNEEMRDKVIQGACFCFYNLIIKTDIGHEFMSKTYGNLIGFLISLLDMNMAGEYKNHKRVLETACWALDKLWITQNYNLTDNYDIVRSNEGFEKIVSLLNHEDNKVVAGACWCFGKLALVKDNVKESYFLKVGPLLVDLIERNIKNQKLVILLLRCVGTICVNNCSDAQLIEIGLRGMPLFLDLLVKQSENNTLPETCSWAVASLLTSKENQALFIKHNGFAKVRELFQKECSDKTIEVLLFIYSKLLTNEDALSHVTQDDVHNIIIFKNHAVAKIAEFAALCLKHLAEKGLYQGDI